MIKVNKKVKKLRNKPDGVFLRVLLLVVFFVLLLVFFIGIAANSTIIPE